MGFLHKLHIIYLINDVLHHSARKSTQDVKPVFQDVIVPIFSCTFVGESPENQQRLGKVIRIWETNSYFDSEIIEVRLMDHTLVYLYELDNFMWVVNLYHF